MSPWSLLGKPCLPLHTVTFWGWDSSSNFREWGAQSRSKFLQGFLLFWQNSWKMNWGWKWLQTLRQKITGDSYWRMMGNYEHIMQMENTSTLKWSVSNFGLHSACVASNEWEKPCVCSPGEWTCQSCLYLSCLRGLFWSLPTIYSQRDLWYFLYYFWKKSSHGKKV